jgi:hypothetical protein
MLMFNNINFICSHPRCKRGRDVTDSDVVKAFPIKKNDKNLAR